MTNLNVRRYLGLNNRKFFLLSFVLIVGSPLLGQEKPVQEVPQEQGLQTAKQALAACEKALQQVSTGRLSDLIRRNVKGLRLALQDAENHKNSNDEKTFGEKLEKYASASLSRCKFAPKLAKTTPPPKPVKRNSTLPRSSPKVVQRQEKAEPQM